MRRLALGAGVVAALALVPLVFSTYFTGAVASRALYLGLLGVALVLVIAVAPAHPLALVALVSAVVMVPAVRRIRSGATGLALIPVLRDTGRAELVYGVLLGLGLALS